ncbi:unnamed protein product [Lymnaea stagnalis]|uniref:DUF1330 domain-containing protein n=1 Tax=Lymnaea stagnalis TaxID=6523 RepID=A0AAV2HST9_LYMST
MDRYKPKKLQSHEWGYVPERWPVRQWNPPQGHGVYLFIRFPGRDVEFAAQTVVLGKRAVTTARGEFIGIARKVHDLSSGPHQKEALVVYLFESTEAATRFFVSDNRFKQPDFPPPAGACEAWTVVKFLQTRDDDLFKTYMLCDNTLRAASYSEYKERFAHPFSQLILDYGGQPFVVQSIGADSLRRHHVEENTMVTMHLFKNEEDIKKMMGDPRYEDLKRRQIAMATDFTSVFTIDSQACP